MSENHDILYGNPDSALALNMQVRPGKKMHRAHDKTSFQTFKFSINKIFNLKFKYIQLMGPALNHGR